LSFNQATKSVTQRSSQAHTHGDHNAVMHVEA